MFPAGFLGTRADLLLDVIVVAVTLVPFLLLYSFNQTRFKKYSRHAKVQWIIFTVVALAVILFEINIQQAGGSGSLLRESPYAENLYFRSFLLIHITVASLTYFAWFLLLLASGKKWKQQLLPGRFSISHKSVGKSIFAGACFTSVSGLIVYYLGFIAS